MRVRMAMMLAAGILIAVSGLARAQSGGDASAEYVLSAAEGLGTGYDLTWHTVDNGGDSFGAGNGYQLGGTIGQPDAGVLSGGDYTFVGGFWGGVGPVSAALEHAVYLPCLLRGFASVSQ